ncbi:Protein like protein [Verticillium longisporum]|nr:Protein like protein [Verticillium longisporum]
MGGAYYFQQGKPYLASPAIGAMSRASKLTLMGTSFFALGTIIMVHFQQRSEKQAMHQGVLRDMEQQRVKRERQLDFDLQRALEQEYKREQTATFGPLGKCGSMRLPRTFHNWLCITPIVLSVE